MQTREAVIHNQDVAMKNRRNIIDNRDAVKAVVAVVSAVATDVTAVSMAAIAVPTTVMITRTVFLSDHGVGHSAVSMGVNNGHEGPS